jgi:hypothetical protein
MARKYTIEAERETEDADGNGVVVPVRVTFSFTGAGPSGGTWAAWPGCWVPPDDEEIEFHAACVLIDGRWVGIPWQAPLSEWAAKWLDEHHDEAREVAGDDDDAAHEARDEMRRDE